MLKLARPVVSRKHGIEVRVPLPLRNTVQGGAHGVVKAKIGARTMKFEMSDLAIQERHLIPNTYDMAANQVMANTIQNVAMNIIFGADGMAFKGTCNEGGIGAFFRQHGEMGAWRVMREAVATAGYELGQDVFFGVDGAADRFYRGMGVYELDGRSFDVDQLLEYYSQMMTENPIVYAEDLFASTPETREAWDHWTEFTARFGHRAQVSLDDIATTNARLLRPLIERKCGNMLLLKMNQVGTMLEGWRAAETAHAAGLQTVSSHRSTSSVDFMEVEVALALSMARESMGRCIMAKWGGAKLIERAMRYAMAQQWVEDWEAGTAMFDPLSPDVKVSYFKAYPAPLNTGDNTLGVRIGLSDGREISAIVPAGTSTGETEAALVPVEQGVRYVNDIVHTLGLVGTRVGNLPDQLSLTQQLLALEVTEAIRTGKVERDANPLDLQVAAEMKRVFGANTLLAITCAYNRLMAARAGKPSWLAFRQAGEEMNRQGMTLDDSAFYDPILRQVVAMPSQISTHLVRDYRAILDGLDEVHRDELQILDSVFRVEGELVYDVEIRDDKEVGRPYPYLRVRPESKRGLAKSWESRADGDEFVRARDNKGETIDKRMVWVDWVNADKRGPQFKDAHMVAIPQRTGEGTGKIILLIGRFDESALAPEEKLVAFSRKRRNIRKAAMDRGVTMTDTISDVIDQAIGAIPLPDLFEKGAKELYEDYVQGSMGERA